MEKIFRSAARIFAAMFVLALMTLAPGLAARAQAPLLVPVMGESKLVFDSNPDYLNDHTVLRGPDGNWHLIGITHEKLLGGRLPVPDREREFIHATAPALAGPWTRLPPVLQVDEALGETHVWAPFIVLSDNLYYCFYAGGGGHWDAMIDLATSPDLMTWTRYAGNPLFRDFYDARDPMVLRVGDRWVMYYTKTFAREQWNSTVAYRLSPDLEHWSDPQFAFIMKYLPPSLPNSQYTESPFVVAAHGRYYLFICPPDLNYRCTLVFVSDDPFHFEDASEIATLVAHCAEVVKDGEQYYLTHAGWFFDGLYLAPLTWLPSRQFARPMLFADSGESDEYLLAAPGAKKVRWGFVGQKALEAGAGQAIEYSFPVPAGCERLGLVFEEMGECRVTAGDKVELDEGDAGKGEATLHTFEISAPALAGDGSFRVRFEDSGAGAADRPVISYVKVYFR